MLKKNATLQFFSNLEQVSSEVAGADSAIAVAAKTAIDQPSPTAFARVQEELAQMSDDLREKIMSKLHTRMRNDVEAIWGSLPNSANSSRRN